MVLAGALASTHAWLTEFVVAERLCPWASPARASVRTVEASAATIAAEALREARALARRRVVARRDHARRGARAGRRRLRLRPPRAERRRRARGRPRRRSTSSPSTRSASTRRPRRRGSRRRRRRGTTRRGARTRRSSFCEPPTSRRRAQSGPSAAMGCLGRWVCSSRIGRRLRRQTPPVLAARLRGWRAVGGRCALRRRG